MGTKVNKFKVGDRVKVIKYEANRAYGKTGRVVMVPGSGIMSYGVDFEESGFAGHTLGGALGTTTGYYVSESFLEKVPEEAKGGKFKIGDRVKVVRSVADSHMVLGLVGTVEVADTDDTTVGVKFAYSKVKKFAHTLSGRLKTSCGFWVYRSALEKVEEKDTMTPRSSKLNTEHVTRVLQAIDDKENIVMEYVNSKGIKTVRVVQPSGLVSGGFIGYCYLREAVRSFKWEKVVSFNTL